MDMDLVFTDIGHFGFGFTQGYDLVFRIFWTFGLWFFGFLDLVFRTFGLWFFYRILDYFNLFLFAGIKIETLSVFYTFHRFLFALLLGKLICI
jgi:hypothetical protein